MSPTSSNNNNQERPPYFRQGRWPFDINVYRSSTFAKSYLRELTTTTKIRCTMVVHFSANNELKDIGQKGIPLMVLFFAFYFPVFIFYVTRSKSIILEVNRVP